MVINKALLKYGYSKFKLDILEFCDPKDLRKREQYYIDLLKPEYNVLKIAYSSLGYKHTKEALEKIYSNLKNLNLKKRYAGLVYFIILVNVSVRAQERFPLKSTEISFSKLKAS